MRSGGPRIPSLDTVQYGLHYGIVVNNKDPENLDRVKVRLPWLDQGDVDQSHWAQFLTPMSGKDFGWYALPDVDDVVVVMFIAGDYSQPVIIGGVWSTKDESPEPNEDGKNNFRGYRSRSGHRLLLEDSDQTKVVIAEKDNSNVVGLGKMAKASAGPNVCAIFRPGMTGEEGVAISSTNGTFELTADGTLTVEAGKNIKINATGKIDVKAGSNMTLEGSSATKATSSSPSNYDAPMIKIA